MRIELERPLTWPVRPIQTSIDLQFSGPSILVVCADHSLGEDLRNGFERNGHRIHLTSDVCTALDTLEAETSIGIVIVELALPHFDGLALVERMRVTVQRPLQFIPVSARASTEDVVRAMHLNVADFINDPTDGSRIHGALARALALLQTPLQSEAPPAPQHGDVLEEAYRHGMALVAAVKALREGQPQPAAPATPIPKADSGKPVLCDKRRLEILHALQQSRVARQKFFPRDLFEDPCWEMLLDLMVNHMRGRRISVSSLCVASGVAQTTALRRISELNDRGLVRRIADEKDGRRVFVELTEQGITALSAYVEHIHGLP
jgi:DNA-binding response OmpR family regulator/predicted transcriptional regulator